jgi:hypothetical protein
MPGGSQFSHSPATIRRCCPGMHTDAVGNLPPGLAGPVQLELARAEERMPGVHALPGGSRYESKWDGYLH